MSDVTPEFAAGDLTAEEAKRLAWKDDDFPARVAAHVVDHYAREEARRVTSSSATGWDLVADVLDVTAYDAPVKSLFARQPDNKPLAYVGGLHILFGLPKSGKSYVAAIWAAQEIAAGRRVAWFDFDNQRASIVELMRDADVEATAVGTGEEALEALRNGNYDCMVLDLGLPGMSGFDVLDKLDADAPYPTGILGQPRGRTNSPGRVALPEGWLADRDDEAVPEGAEIEDSGG